MRYLAHHRQLRALSLIPQLAGELSAAFGRPSGGLLRTYRTHDAETIVVALGSVNGVIRGVVDELREQGARIGSVTLGSFRPFPLGADDGEVVRGRRRLVQNLTDRFAGAENDLGRYPKATELLGLAFQCRA